MTRRHSIDVIARAPWMSGIWLGLPPGTGLRAMFRLSDTVDYHDGEQAPPKD